MPGDEVLVDHLLEQGWILSILEPKDLGSSYLMIELWAAPVREEYDLQNPESTCMCETCCRRTLIRKFMRGLEVPGGGVRDDQALLERENAFWAGGPRMVSEHW